MAPVWSTSETALRITLAELSRAEHSCGHDSRPVDAEGIQLGARLPAPTPSGSRPPDGRSRLAAWSARTRLRWGHPRFGGSTTIGSTDNGGSVVLLGNFKPSHRYQSNNRFIAGAANLYSFAHSS
jgi:hypothetical protein